MTSLEREIWFRKHMALIAPWVTERRNALVLQRLQAVRYIEGVRISRGDVVFTVQRRSA